MLKRTLRCGAVSFWTVGVILFLCCTPAFSQVNLGRISGNVTDQTGGVLAGATVTITDQDRGTTRSVVTDTAGSYAAPSMIPGLYTVRVEANGFNAFERKNVEVTVGGDMRVDAVLNPGSQTQTVTVTEALPLINTTSATLGGVMESKEVTDLPVIGRNWLFLMQLAPGVITKPGGGSNANASNGMRTDANNYLFEGIFSGGVRTAGDIVNTNSSTGDGASLLPADAIEEVGVNLQNKAEFGWRPGVATNVTVKSGTNSIHGTAFAQGMDGSLDARNPFNPAPAALPLLTYEQYGATAGGPILKDKLFWFFGFEGMQYFSGTPTTFPVPTTALITGTPSSQAGESVPQAYLDLANRGYTCNPEFPGIRSTLPTTSAGRAKTPTNGIFLGRRLTLMVTGKMRISLAMACLAASLLLPALAPSKVLSSTTLATSS